MEDILQIEGKELSEVKRIEANRAALFAALRAEGVLVAVVCYSGSGDSGGPDGVSLEMPDGSQLKKIRDVSQSIVDNDYIQGAWQTSFKSEVQPLDQAITEFAMDSVEKFYGGWENDDGASGEVHFIVANDSITIKHTNYFTDSNYSEEQV
jgi:hypothetical protein